MKFKVNITHIIALISFIFELIAVIVFRPAPLTFIPLFVSVVVLFLQSNINRYYLLLGAANSLFYAAAYFIMKLYATALYSFCVSFPLMLISFINWSRNTKKNVTELKRMSGKVRMIMLFSTVLVWLICLGIFSLFGSPYLVLDNTAMILGILATVLGMLRYREYSFITVINQLTGLATYIIMLKTQPDKIIWVIHTSYAVICSLIAFIKLLGREFLKNGKKDRI